MKTLRTEDKTLLKSENISLSDFQFRGNVLTSYYVEVDALILSPSVKKATVR